MHYNVSLNEYFFQLPKEYVRNRLVRNALPIIACIFLLSIFLGKDWEISLITIAIVFPIYFLMYFFGTSYTYINLSETFIKGVNIYGLSNHIDWGEKVNINKDYKWSFKGYSMDGILISTDMKQSIFIPKVIAETNDFKNTIKKLAPYHPLNNI